MSRSGHQRHDVHADAVITRFDHQRAMGLPAYGDIEPGLALRLGGRISST